MTDAAIPSAEPVEREPGIEREDGAARARGTALLGLLIALHVLLAGRWAWANGWLVRPTLTEATSYRLRAAQSMVALQDEGLRAWIASPYGDPQHHTPLFPMLAGAVGALSGEALSPRVLWGTMMLFAVLFALGVHRLARNFLPPLAAAAAAGLALCTPIVHAYERDFLPTLPMVAGLVWSLDLLVRSRCFQRPWVSLAFGLVAGLATYVKVIAPLYLLGPALVALGLGLRRRSPRVLLHVALAGVGFFAVMGAWLALDLGSMLRYTGEATDTEGLPAAERVLQGERWIYYPRAVLNSGYGLPLGLAILGLAVAGIVRARRATWSARGWMLAALVPVTWLVVSYGQTASGSQYAFLWVPLGCLFAVHQTRTLSRAWERRALAGFLVLAALWNVALGQRSLYADEPGLTWHGLHLVGSTNQYMANWAREMGVLARPQAEPWPVEEFAERLLDDAGPGVPVLARTHPFLGGNLVYEALIRRRPLDYRRMPWSSMLGAHPDFSALADVDYLVTDTRLMRLDPFVPAIAALGIRLEVLATRRVTDASTVRLVAVRRSWVRPPSAPASALDEPTVRRVDVSFADGWRLRGSEVRPVPALGGRPAMHLFFLPPPAAPGGSGEVRVRLEARRGDQTIWSGWHTIVPPDARRAPGWRPGELLVVPFPLVDVSPDPGNIFLVRLTPPASRRPPVAVLSSDRPRQGSAVVVAP